MAAHLSTLWYVDSPRPVLALRNYPDPHTESAASLARTLFGEDVTHVGTAPLADVAAGSEGVLHIGVFPGVTVVCLPLPDGMLPSQLPQQWRRRDGQGRTLLVMSSEDGARGSFAEWHGKDLHRAFCADAAHIFEDHGLPQPWEQPFWGGEFPMKYPLNVLPDPQMLPFHPQHFAESANREWLGFRYTAVGPEDDINPAKLLVHTFRAGAPEVTAAPADVQDLATVGGGKRPPRRRPSLMRWFGFRSKRDRIALQS
ncbi:MAG: hypothetical protein GX542_14060 [Rhodococcus sp.]|nr:hypothetical protein [Rhodococcus sp. (in: high G+C Gram-positive bacteria)]